MSSSKLNQAKERLGQLFIIGFDGLELSNETSAFISQAKIGGVVLFAPNYESPAQVAELCNQVQECRTEFPLWISVDHEGGRVQRFKKGFTLIPDAASIGATQSPKLVFEISELMAKELKAVGINMNFCPVADIATNPKNPIIGNRAFGNNEEDVSKMITAMVRGHLVQGVQPCVKHFPGHGDTSVDSHLALPRVDTSLEVLKEREFKPFLKAFRSHCHLVMTAHILVTELDPQLPATLSTKILRDLLRREMRYSRVIISDDLEMKAITDHFGAEDAPRMALEASCDLLIYRTEMAARKAYESLLRDLESGKLKPEIVLEAADRSIDLKKEVLLPFHSVPVADVRTHVGTPENQAIVERVGKK